MLATETSSSEAGKSSRSTLSVSFSDKDPNQQNDDNDDPRRLSIEIEPRQSPPPLPFGTKENVQKPFAKEKSTTKRTTQGAVPIMKAATQSAAQVQQESHVLPTPPLAFLTHPSIHTSDSLRQRASELAAKLQHDDISIASVDTSPSERVEAATKARTYSGRDKRYGSALVDFTSDSQVKDMMPSRPTIGKQIDENWYCTSLVRHLFIHFKILLRRRVNKRALGPPPEVLKTLETPAPVINYSLSYSTAPTKGSGLRIGFDPVTLHPTFNAPLPYRDIFTGVDSITDIAAAESKARWSQNFLELLPSTSTIGFLP
jgi:hypothetical protein